MTTAASVPRTLIDVLPSPIHEVGRLARDGALVAGESPEGETPEGELEAAPAEGGAAAEAVSETSDDVTGDAPPPDRDVQ